MTWENQMLRVLAERQYHTEFSRIAMRPNICSDDIRDLVILFGVYYARNKLVNKIEYSPLVKWINIHMKPKGTEEENKLQLRCLLLTEVFKEDITDEMIEDTRDQLCKLCFVEEATTKLLEYNDGVLQEDVMEAIDEIMIKYSDLSRKTHLSPIRKDIGTILREQDDENGLALPLEGLNKTVAPQKEGDFILIGAQNNTGKTALAVQIAVHYAKQLPKDAKILYLNNEGIGDHIILRLRQVALELGKYALEEGFKSGIPIEDMYRKKINGDSHKIEVIDVHGINVAQVQSILRYHKPQVVIYDMLDAVHGFGGGGMDVDRYKQLYAWTRSQCANPEYRHIGIALTQVSHDGHEHTYVPKHALEGSKVAKQSQTDVLIMVGMKEEQPQIRYIHVPRCKRTRKGGSESTSRFMCSFDGNIGMYVDAVGTTEVTKETS